MATRVETNPLETAYVVLLEQGWGAGEGVRIQVDEAARTEADRLLKTRPDSWRKEHPNLAQWPNRRFPWA